MYVTIEMMLRVCLYQLMSIHERQTATQDSVMLSQLHQQLFQEMVHFHLIIDTIMILSVFTGI